MSLLNVMPCPLTLPPELLDSVFCNLQPDTPSIRSCTLVCHAWLVLSRPYLFRSTTLVCRPAVPLFSFNDLDTFLSESPEIVRHIRAFKVHGANPNPMHYVEVAVEDVHTALSRLPNVICIEFELVLFIQQILGDASIPVNRRCIEEATFRSCFIKDDYSFYRLFAPIKSITALVLDHVRCMESSVRYYPGFPPDYLQIDDIHITALLSRTIRPLQGFFRTCRTHSPLRLFLTMTEDLEDDTTLGTFLPACKDDVTSVSANVLGAVCKLGWMVDGVPPRCEPGPPPRTDLSGCISLRKLVLYFTTSSAMQGPPATRLYARIFSGNVLLISRSSPSLRHITFRFERYGPYVRHMVEDMQAIGNMGPIPPWRRLDALINQRFPHLEAVVFVVGDEPSAALSGRVPREASGYDRSVPTSGREEEFDSWVAFLVRAFPQLNERGFLRFKMSTGSIGACGEC